MIVKGGPPVELPAVSYDKAITIFQSSTGILWEVLAAVGGEEDVHFHHDPDWEQFPEVGEALKRANGEEDCFAVVECASLGKWAVGVASGKKGREAAGKLALALACAAGTSELESVANANPEFRGLCVSAGLLQQPATAFRGAGQGQSGKQAAESWAQAGPGVHQAPPLYFISLEGTNSKLLGEGLPSDAPAVYFVKDFADFYKRSGAILGQLGVNGTEGGDIEFEHDADWEIFPEIAEAVKQAGGEEDGLCVAKCPLKNVWAVGCAAGWRNRESAAKLAICVALAAASSQLEELTSSDPVFGRLCASVGLVEPPAKRARGGW